MDPDHATAASFPPGTSRYTIAMAKCLANLGPRPDPAANRTIIHALVNLVQGRMLEYLADRICREYHIEDPVPRQRIVTVLLGIFSDEFFALFRAKLEFRPGLVIEVARRIIRKESHTEPGPAVPFRRPSDRLYPAIFRKYFEYRDLEHLLEMVASDAEIQKIVLGTIVRERVGDAGQREQIFDILERDEEGERASLFMRYLQQGSLETLLERVRSESWRDEAEAMRLRMALLRGE